MGQPAKQDNVVPFDPRDPQVFDKYSDDPQPEPYLNIPAPRPTDGAYQASIVRSIQARDNERRKALEDAAPVHAYEFVNQCLLDTTAALRLERAEYAWPPDISDRERKTAAAVAIRLSDPQWQTISRYHAADAILVELRKSQSRFGWYLADSDMRELADNIAGISHRTRIKVLVGEIAATALQWSKAKFNFLRITEER